MRIGLIFSFLSKFRLFFLFFLTFSNFFRSILTYFGDNRGQPFLGPGKIKFLDISTLGIIDKINGFHIISINGTINTSISSSNNHLMKNNNKKNNENKKLNEREREKDNENENDFENEYEFNYNEKNKNKHNNEEEEEVKIKYLDIVFNDFCDVPLTKNLAICDKNTDTIKIVNRDDWSIDRSLGQPNLQAAPIFSQLSCIDSFKINFKTFYSLAQLESDRVMIVSEGGNILHIIGESGILPGQFDNPISISSCILPKFHDEASKVSSTIPIPGWYLGQTTTDQLVSFMNRPKNHYPRNFRICQRPRVPHIFDVVYISSSGILVNCQIQKDRVTGDVAMITSTGTKLKSYPSINHLVKNFNEFYQVFYFHFFTILIYIFLI